ncbi:AsmA-like C-terminal region-containing protein [Rhodospirillales bacterium]|nr:AsmA-like C-terminal region-containing protein [Rhodospirillales bacterium]
MMGRITRTAVHLIGMLVVGSVIAGGVLAWRLASGPISLAFLTPYFETALSSESGAFKTVFKDTILTWVTTKRAIDIQLVETQVLGRQGELLAEIPELSVSLSASALMRGRLAPKSLSIDGLRISLIRRVDGTFSLDFSKEKSTGKVLIANLLNGIFQPPDTENSLGSLKRLDILNASLTLSDQKSDIFWDAPLANIILNRDKAGLTVDAEINLKLGSSISKLSVRGLVDSVKRDISLKVGFSDLVASSVPDVLTELSFLKSIKIPVNGTIATKISSNGAVGPVHFDIQLNKGTVDVTKPLDLTFSVEKGRLVGSFDMANSLFAIEACELNLGPQGTIYLPNIINKKLPLRRISIVANYFVNKQKLEFEKILADLVGPTLRLRGVFQEIAEQISFEIGADIKDLKIGTMAQFWPNNLAPLAQAWVTKNLSVGSISAARAKLSGRWSEATGSQVDSLIGDMNFNNLTVDYFSPMLKATRASGTAKFDKRMLEIELDDAQRGDLKLSYGRLLFTGLDEVDQYTDITLKIDGPLKSAVKLLDDKPLGFAKKMGIKAENVQGLVSTDINLKFIVEEKLTPDQLVFSAKATLIRGNVPDVAFEKTLTNATLMLNANNSTLKIEGEGLLDNIPVKLKWLENFDDSAEFRSRYDLSGQLSAKNLRNSLDIDPGYFDERYLSGNLKFDLTAVVNSIGKGKMTTVVDLKETRISIPEIGWHKSKLVESKIEFSAIISESGIEKIQSLSVMAGGVKLKGSAELEDKNFLKFNLIDLKYGDFSASGEILHKISSDGEFRTEFDVSGQLNSKNLRETRKINLSLLDERLLLGILKFDLKGVISPGAKEDVSTVIGLKEARISFPVGGDLMLIGDAELKDKVFHKFTFRNLSFGETVVAGDVLRDGKGWQIDLRGPELDLTALLEKQQANGRKYVRGPPVRIGLNIDRIKLSEGKYLHQVSGRLWNDGLVWSNINLNSIFDEKNSKKHILAPKGSRKSLEINLSPKAGKRELQVKSSDAGWVLDIFGFSKDIIGGKLALEAIFEDMSVDSKVTGTAKIHKFRLVDAPVLARLLSIASITGILDELDGEGLKFEELEAPFLLENGIIYLKNAKAGGLSLGITASGDLDWEAETLDIKGSVAPLDKINSLLGRALRGVPLFGEVFSGGEKGGSLFAAEYSMVGPIDGPEINTNPLTALTPGIFRKIFQILPGKTTNGHATEWRDPDDPN